MYAAIGNILQTVQDSDIVTEGEWNDIGLSIAQFCNDLE